MKFHHFLLGAALLAAFPKVAFAEDASNPRLHAAWDALAKGEGEFLTSKQFASLNNLAYQAAIVRICDGHELDHDAFRDKIEDVINDTDKSSATSRPTCVKQPFSWLLVRVLVCFWPKAAMTAKLASAHPPTRSKPLRTFLS